METISLKALAHKVLQRNSQGNSMETQTEQTGNYRETFNDMAVSLLYSTSLETLSDSERDIFHERVAIMEHDGGLERERAEVEAIKRIIRDRVIPGKCDKCRRVKGCMLTKGMRELCGGPKFEPE